MARGKRNVEFEGDSDQEFEGESEDSEYGEDSRRCATRRKGSAASAFIDDKAIEVDEDDEEDDLDDADDDFIVHNEDELPEEDESRMHHHSRSFPLQEGVEDLEEVARRLQERYGRTREAELDQDEDLYEDFTEIEQRSLLPSIGEPKLFMVKCQIGREREAAVHLMQKSIQRPELHIYSVIALDHLRNYIYIEADKEGLVKEACKDLLFLSCKKLIMVPISEMADVLSVRCRTSDITLGQWVRINSGMYKGDLAKVIGLHNIQHKVTVKIIPRIDLQELSNKLAGLQVMKKPCNPPARRIISREVREMNISVLRKHDPATGKYFEKIGGMMFRDGFLYKSFSMRSIITHDINPTIDELEGFLEIGKNQGRRVYSNFAGDTRRASFVKGDRVHVIKGDIKNMKGIIEKVVGDYAHIRPDMEDLLENVVVNVKDMCKYFEPGNHVKVVSGTHAGVTGLVAKVEDQVLVVLADSSMEEIHVFADAVVESSKVASSVNMNNYELHDLVLLSDGSFGVITRVLGNVYEVLKGIPHQTQIKQVKTTNINSKIQKMGTADDNLRNILSVKDVIQILNGPFKGKRGPIKYIYKQILFIHDHEHNSLLCVRAESCTLLGGTNARFSSGGNNMFLGHKNQRSLVNYGGRNQNRRWHDSFIGSRVKVCQGQYKGSYGRVVNVNGQLVRVELEAQMRTVTVNRIQISNKVNALIESRAESGAFTRPQTPLRPCMTPMREPGTPIHDGMRTPMHSQAWNPCHALPSSTSYRLAGSPSP